MITLEGQDELLLRLWRIGNDRALLKATRNAFRKSARQIRYEIRDKARTRGILKTIFGRRKGGLTKGIKLGRVRKIPTNNFEAALTTKGGAGALLAIQELGGRFGPHTIKPKSAPKLVFVTHGKLVATTHVSHPGATHPRMPVFWPTVKRSGPQLRRDVAEAIRAHLRTIGRIA